MSGRASLLVPIVPLLVPIVYDDSKFVLKDPDDVCTKVCYLAFKLLVKDILDCYFNKETSRPLNDDLKRLKESNLLRPDSATEIPLLRLVVKGGCKVD